MDERALRDLALRQHGVVSRAQVLAAGGTDTGISHRVAAGRWERVRTGVYAIGAAPATWQRWAQAAVLAAGPSAHLTSRSAIRAWGLVDRSGAVQLLVPGDRRVRLPGVEVHRTQLLEPVDVGTAAGLPVTSLSRSLIELAPSQSARTMGTFVDAAIRLHHLDVDVVASRIAALNRPGRPMPRSLMEALLLRSPGHDPGRSALESRLLAVLAAGGLPEPVRQHPVVRPDGRTALLDLAYPPQLLAIEADGWAFHGQRAAFDADRIRQNELVLLGWRVLRITSAMADSQICRVVATALGR